MEVKHEYKMLYRLYIILPSHEINCSPRYCFSFSLALRPIVK
jgi:hypothetical protein